MAIYFCKKCFKVKEVSDKYINKKVKCKLCGQSITIHQVESFVTHLLKEYTNTNEKLQELIKKQDKEVILLKEKKIAEKENKSNIDFTKKLTPQRQSQKIKKWFELRNIKVEININNIDTTGFFDEIALTIGHNFKVLKPLLEQIKYVQKKEYTNVKFNITHKSPKEISQITSFCQELYKYSLVSKYFYDKKLKIIRINLQTVPKVKSFFNGVWMEWFIMMELLSLFKEKNKKVSLMRSIKILHYNGQTNELDIFLLTEKNKAIYIECKTGEFREDVNKYLQLQKKLDIDKEHFILCILGLSKSHSIGLTTMYDLKFLNENSILNQVEKLI